VKLDAQTDTDSDSRGQGPASAAATQPVGRAWGWLGALLVLVVAAWAFDTLVLPLALAPTASEEAARAAEVAWWALTLLTAGTGTLAAAHLLLRCPIEAVPAALARALEHARGGPSEDDRP
jgi:hypothetical protein